MKTQQLQQQYPEQIPFTQEMVKEILDLAEINENGFLDFSKSLDKLFYEYVQFLLFKDETLLIKSEDVFNFMQMKRLFDILQENLINNHNE